jgi:hypothetical protein
MVNSILSYVVGYLLCYLAYRVEVKKYKEKIEAMVQYIRYLESQSTVPTHGLKDHETRELINSVRDILIFTYGKHINFPQSLREVIAESVRQYLINNNLKIDKQ